MASPIGLGFNENKFDKSKAKYRYDTISKTWKTSSNQNYETSMFNEGDSLTYFPETSDPSNGYMKENEIIGVNNTPHGLDKSGNSIYDVRTQAIIDWTQGSGGSGGQSNAMKLTASDFAYLRYLGVYPNNRLIVCRKFKEPVGNDLSKGVGTDGKDGPVSKLLTWRAPGEDFFKISFSEKWEDAEASFTEILNEIGKEFSSGKNAPGEGLGTKLAGGLGAVPLPGFTEIFQRQIMFAMGLIDKDGRDIIPAGTPNLIKIAKKRETIDPDKPGSGLECTISVPVKVEYEQKFIGGLDPTKAFYDILANVAKFGTQDSIFYLNGIGERSKEFKEFFTALKNNPLEAITNLLKKVINELAGLVDDIIKSLGLGGDDGGEGGDGLGGGEKEEKSIDFKDVITNLLKTILGLVTGLVRKYQVRILGVVHALTGDPSGTWHVTIGNPKRPIFTSGDMICDEVSVTLGETLAFNDLPSRITVEFTLKNARPIGLQEIMSRFMQAQGRSYVSGPSSWVESSGQSSMPPVDKQENEPPIGGTGSNTTPVGGVAASDSQSDGSQAIGSTQSNETFATGEGQESNINKEPNPDDIRNPNNVTDTPPPVANDVKPEPGASVEPAAGVDSSNKPMNDAKLSSANDSELKDRRNKIDEELANTPATTTDRNGATILNPEREKLEEEKRKIDSELEDRDENNLLQK